ncbi:MAG: PilZ domain-containing protein [Deltaproteobacteria bacterium]|nr:PilZ domain-containing protein [Deltaproteobacteria bacterium]
MENHRQVQRNFLKYYLDVKEEPEGEVIGQLYDLSDKGMMLLSERSLEENMEMDFWIGLKENVNGKNMIRGRAKSLRCVKDMDFDKHRIGFQFIEISREDTETINQLIERFGYNINL